jgi:hypothetical protein
MNWWCLVRCLLQGSASMKKRFISFTCSSTMQSARTVNKNKKIRPTERKELIYILRNTIFHQTITCLFLFCLSSSLLRIISPKHYSSLINVSPTKCTCSQFYYGIITYHFLLHVWALLGHYHRELNRRGKVHKALVCIIRKCSFFIYKTATSVYVCVYTL